MTDQNPTHDEVINELSLREKRVVVTKDSDFYHSHLLHGKPWKLLLIRTGNVRTREPKGLFQQHLPAIVAALENNSLVELDRQTVKWHRLVYSSKRNMVTGMSARIEINPRVCGGQPVIKGARISVAALLEQLEEGESWKPILRGY